MFKHINEASTFIFQATDELSAISYIHSEYSMPPSEAPLLLFAQTFQLKCRGGRAI